MANDLGPCPGCGRVACVRIGVVASGPVGIVFGPNGAESFRDKSRIVVPDPAEGAAVQCAQCLTDRPGLEYRGGRVVVKGGSDG